MALKHKISKADFDKLPDAIKSEYIADGDGYRLDVEGFEDVGPLKRAKDREAQLRREAEERLRTAQEELDRINGDDARKRGDIQTLEKSWQKKLEDKETELNGKLSNRDNFIKSQLVDNVASQVAHKISKAPAILLPHIKARLTADFEGDTPVTRVLDAAGKPSAMTVEELTAEFVANKDFSAIILASQASGGAGASKGNGGGAPNNPGSNNAGNQPPDLSKMKPAQLAAHLKEAKAQNQDA